MMFWQPYLVLFYSNTFGTELGTQKRIIPESASATTLMDPSKLKSKKENLYA